MELGCKILESHLYTKKKNGKTVAVEYSKNNPRLISILIANKLILGRIEQKALITTVAKSNKVREFSDM